MATKMIFVCSCGLQFDIGDSTGMEAHLDANDGHSATEGYVPAVDKSLATAKDRIVSEIKTHRDDKRLAFDLFAEYPPASGNFFSCSPVSQDNWAKLATLDLQAAVVYPFTVTTYDERASYDLLNAADRESATLAIARVVLAERDVAETYITAVLATTTVAAAQTAAAPYLVRAVDE